VVLDLPLKSRSLPTNPHCFEKIGHTSTAIDDADSSVVARHREYHGNSARRAIAGRASEFQLSNVKAIVLARFGRGGGDRTHDLRLKSVTIKIS
jgi:hypothetical protein